MEEWVGELLTNSLIVCGEANAGYSPGAFIIIVNYTDFGDDGILATI